jgi:bifunctional DNA-binding transcriptional regulator/antitoxin component of YhaV-PrlF toxin-antitoxin module
MIRIILNTTTNGRAQIPMGVRQLLNIISGDQIIVEIIDVIHIGQDNAMSIDQISKSKVNL